MLEDSNTSLWPEFAIFSTKKKLVAAGKAKALAMYSSMVLVSERKTGYTCL